VSHRATALVAVCALLAGLAAPGAADVQQHLRAGDKLTYDISVQVQENTRAAATSTNKKPAPEAGSASAGTGTETIDVTSVDADGTAHGSLAVDMLGFTGGQPLALHTVTPVTIALSGEIRPSAAIDPLIDQTFFMINAGIRDLATHELHVGAAWRWLLPASSYPMTIGLDRQVRGQQDYLTLPTFIVQTVGGGATGPNDPVDATLDLAGTYYYDQRDGIFVGEALRSDATVIGATAESADASTLVTVALRAIVRSPQPAATPTPAPAEVEASPAPTAIPTQYEAQPVPTVTPRTS